MTFPFWLSNFRPIFLCFYLSIKGPSFLFLFYLFSIVFFRILSFYLSQGRHPISESGGGQKNVLFPCHCPKNLKTLPPFCLAKNICPAPTTPFASPKNYCTCQIVQKFKPETA
jgi:hypothetical protein